MCGRRMLRTPFSTRCFFVVVLVLCILLFKSIGVFHAFDTIAAYLH